MGNIFVLSLIIVLFGGITYYLIKTYKTKGTTCTSCTACPIVQKCNKDTLKSDVKAYYKSQS